MSDVNRELLYAGKAKDIYKSENENEVIIKFRDDITAGDGAKKDTLSQKGYCNVLISAKLFKVLEENGVKTQYIELLSTDEMRTKSLEMIPLEVICRNIATGSLLKKYPFEANKELKPPIIQFDYKNDEFHDPMLNDSIIKALEIATQEELDEIREITLKINKILSDYLIERGIILVDFKLEYGKDSEGNIILGDEISPDTTRLWDSETYENFDKDIYRKGEEGVVDAYLKVVNLVLSDEEKVKWNVEQI
ncbi:phosphoribosylaminoimidazolesuccinocarboxamide synthase [Methanosphaera sp. ISO3-F5]|uniref:phosphoribosylaminoimidazolesuccinocarboxamide synthase n=1 Tax=Methanosphaera sp. ISO3-F5 TaxID=1452353 RepID=UPI002B25B222|nr:phosphoribosylaminoimidazolesuccinocarboxamide synthase [Methanosphaera sp. ISO3-F5]WQH64523.1 phosphoribosylaminoimidazolesuccinocarboxamide synthase [Methanosphaera sp. ISO3-F5]